MSDINKNISEAPDLKGNVKGRPNTLGQRLKQKVKKHTPFSAKKRGEAETKDQIFKQAKQLKNEFAKHMQNLPDGTEPTIAHLEEFFNGTEYEQYVNQVAIDLRFRKSEEKTADGAEQETEQRPEGPTKAGGDTDGDNLTLVDEPEAKNPQADPEDRQAQKSAGSAEIKRAAEEESRRLNPDDTDIEGDLPEEAGEDAEPKVDTSASIYESRLASMLFELKDNEVDTMIVRIIQAKNRAKGGAPTPATDEIAQQSPRDEKSSNEFTEPDTKEMNDDATVPGAYKKKLFNLLKKISKGATLDKNDKKVAGALYKKIN